MLELHPGNWNSCSECCSIQENSSTYHPLVVLRPPPATPSAWTAQSSRQPGTSVWCWSACAPGSSCWGRCASCTPLVAAALGSGLVPAERPLHGLMLGSKESHPLGPDVGGISLAAFAQSRYCQLSVLPSSKSCSWQLSSTSGLHRSTEMDLAMQQGSSCASLSLEQAAASSASSTVWARELPSLRHMAKMPLLLCHSSWDNFLCSLRIL
ncbi:hypothetical protein TURU_065665 [Turdus rufiventris]|nr:hypothetical protein TURU_065665 [Turdus rufiventris]